MGLSAYGRDFQLTGVEVCLGHDCTLQFRPMLGSHLSIAGGMTLALEAAVQLKLECLQVFTKNQRQWRVKPLENTAIDLWTAQLKRMKWLSNDGCRRVVSHNSYLINLASPDKSNWSRSLELQRVEMERCETLMIPLLVAHPGAHLGESLPPGTPHKLGAKASKDEQAGLKRIVRALDRLHKDLPGYRVRTCLETTVGSGTNLGYDFAHLEWIRNAVREPERIGFCFDTCHVTAAGYDMGTDAKAEKVLKQFEAGPGFDQLLVFHLNDSVGALSSRRDRHAHIGEGHCGKSAFRAILDHPCLRSRPMILETPKGDTPKGTPWDTINIRRLRRLSVANRKSR